uniref:Uncharacterized protein n=1 Tax=Oncorhynchus kisutch TaxID=8019 RepID=A0A8C7JQA3_ONCKI
MTDLQNRQRTPPPHKKLYKHCFSKFVLTTIPGCSDNSTLTPKFRAEQYPMDYYESGDKLFCEFCQHTIDWTRKNMCDSLLKSEAHVKNREKHRVTRNQTIILPECTRPFTPPINPHIKQSTESFLDFVAVCAESDIPLEKLRKLWPFLVKHCKQGGELPENESSLRQTHLPRVFNQHMTAVLLKIRGKRFTVVVDETTDTRDCSVLTLSLVS